MATTWHQRLKVCNGCDGCGDRCVADVPMTVAEYARIKEALAAMDPHERKRVLEQQKTVPWPGAPEFHYQACQFRDLENGRCSVYEARPLVCRLFGHVGWLPCPIGAVPSVSEAGARLMLRSGRQERLTFAQWEERGPLASGH